MGSMCCGNQSVRHLAQRLSWDHKPEVEQERMRIEQSGGEVIHDGYCARVYARGGKSPGLNMSRALGDLTVQDRAGISCEPTVNEFVLDDEEDNEALLFLCSDGIWEFVGAEELASLVNTHTKWKT